MLAAHSATMTYHAGGESYWPVRCSGGLPRADVAKFPLSDVYRLLRHADVGATGRADFRPWAACRQPAGPSDSHIRLPNP